MLIAADRRQARTLFNYISVFFGILMLARMVRNKLKESIELNNGVAIEIHTASFRSVRGYSIIAAIADECAFWPSEDSANPDTEVINALRPAMATIPNALMLGISSPYARRGLLWQQWREHYGKSAAPVLVWQAPTEAMNPTVGQWIISAAYAADQASAAAEYGAQFRSDIESLLSLEAVEACVIPNRHELPPLSDVNYLGFVDPSGGSSDSMTMAIAHDEKGTAVLDAVREVTPPFSPESVVREFAQTLKSYRVHQVVGDRYAGEWPREQFSKHGIQYKPSERTKSEIYAELLPGIMSHKVELLDNRKLLRQLVGLERKTSRAGRDSIDHAPSAHDDVANSAAGVLVMALSSQASRCDGVGRYFQNMAAKMGTYDSMLFKDYGEFQKVRVELGLESAEDQKLFAEQAARRRIQIEQHLLAQQRPEERIKLRDGSTVRWNRFLNCWQDVMNPAKTYKNCPGPTHVEGRR